MVLRCDGVKMLRCEDVNPQQHIKVISKSYQSHGKVMVKSCVKPLQSRCKSRWRLGTETLFYDFFWWFPIKVVLLQSVNDERKTLEIKTRL